MKFAVFAVWHVVAADDSHPEIPTLFDYYVNLDEAMDQMYDRCGAMFDQETLTSGINTLGDYYFIEKAYTDLRGLV